MGLFENLALAAPELFTVKIMLLMVVGTFAGLMAGAIPGIYHRHGGGPGFAVHVYDERG